MMPISATGTPERGFTLIEVLVALFVLAVALAAGMRALGGVTHLGEAVPVRLAAQWSATNALNELRLGRQWPPVGGSDFACPQGRFVLSCHENVQETPNPSFRLVEVTVFLEGEGSVLARVSTVVPLNPAQVL
ncbi:type II secretion system minor pseudopilin GspI [Ferrovum sp.]|uniref:type II secretion system minor pseudopilin GspI n=1 Tax=Ferrovum sp. TaxID=2609467 RepID=UPI0026240678|nr:type II secretion system minor pseudopilin GspI [Ferrovum sp.]